MADTITGPTGKARMLKTGKTARGRNGPGTRRRLTPMHFLRIARPRHARGTPECQTPPPTDPSTRTSTIS
jgi:hypothetical protein